MKEQKNYETIKKWNEGKISFKRAKLKLKYSERHIYRLKNTLHKKAKKDLYMVIEDANQRKP